MNDFRGSIREYVSGEALPRDKFGHQPRLYELTKAVGAGYIYDDDVVFAATWLHDLGVYSGHRPEDPALLAAWDNVAYAVERAPSILRSCGFPLNKIDAVAEAIRTHQPSGQPVKIEGIILRDADILEQLGAMAVLRTACKVGRDTRFPTFTAVADSLRASLANLPGQIRLDTTRALAAPKIELLELFLAGLEREAYGALY